ncbi:putative ATP-dependent DNA helicase HFM1-like [Platysternon megacephalum]|uniref:Putative ATP-dependent DNA helicase HFM1-like n=1 Tax=Platysternon megacephalum TaxID=55544 RepID=A0A4D9EG73_9SAUR|nr:putative ATP-dependent DNA helicase HFM1-like [Platysternon megacephalum]
MPVGGREGPVPHKQQGTADTAPQVLVVSGRNSQTFLSNPLPPGENPRQRCSIQLSCHGHPFPRPLDFTSITDKSLVGPWHVTPPPKCGSPAWHCSASQDTGSELY